jgi:Ca-activated chloride channel family protein
LRRLGSDLAERSISVTTIGVGDDYNEDLMAGLAEASDANYYYVQDTEKLPEIFARELGELLTVAAREIRIEITCPDGVQPLGFIGRSERFENQRASVNLSQFTLGQGRYLFLRCLVTRSEPEVARVKVSYTDELDNGSEQSTSGVVKIRYTDEQTVADRSINSAVNAEKVLMLTAVAKDEAIAQADAGNYQQAAATLAVQRGALSAACANAPAEVQVQIRAETNNLDDFSGQLVNGQYNGASRKSLQSQSYNTRNSK